MDYAAARAALDELPRFEVKPGLERIGRLLAALGDPECTYPAIHVAGTNGKGSVVAMLEAVLRASGRQVGRFTSPQIVDFRDRIAVDGRWLSEREWGEGVERLAPTLSEMADPPAQFEAITALALDAFVRARVDLAVVEVGLGGRFDATNLVRPILSILTNVALDHTAILGDSIERIAWEKTGIAKEGVPLLLGPVPENALRVAERSCAEAGAELVCVDGPGIAPVSEGDGFVRYRVDGDDLPGTIDLPLLGGYQAENLRTALAAIHRLRKGGLEIPTSAIEEGLRTVSWPGRFEIVGRAPTVILEGAHNVAGARALAADVERRVPERARRSLVFGALADKDVAGMLRVLGPCFERVILTESESLRALPVDRLGDIADGLRIPHACYHSVEGALASGLDGARADDVWVVAGSLTVVGAARRFLEDEG